MTSFKRVGSKPVVKYAYIGGPVVKYAYIGISADRQRHNLFWLFKYRICPIRIEMNYFLNISINCFRQPAQPTTVPFRLFYSASENFTPISITMANGKKGGNKNKHNQVIHCYGQKKNLS